MKYLNEIVTGDARELAKEIPDESIDLIFTDPIYDRIEDYEWLGSEARRILKPDGNLLVFYGQQYLSEVVIALHKHIDIRMSFNNIMFAYYPIRRWGKIGFKNVPLLWASNNKGWPRKFISDVQQIKSHQNKDGLFKWSKGLSWIKTYVYRFTKENEITFDPFCGSGVIPIACNHLGRDYIAFEVDAETAELARRQIASFQPPLIIPELEQLELQ